MNMQKRPSSLFMEWHTTKRTIQKCRHPESWSTESLPLKPAACCLSAENPPCKNTHLHGQNPETIAAGWIFLRYRFLLKQPHQGNVLKTYTHYSLKNPL